MIQTIGVSKKFDDVQAVNSLSLEIRQGEVFGLVGTNVSGKSTLLRMLCGILKPTEGSVRINGLDPFQERVRNSKEIGVVFGNRSILWWDVPVIESYRLFRRLYEITEKRFRENLEKFTSGIRRFTVGMAKKVLLANQFGLLWDAMSADPAAAGALGAWWGACAYTLQIYFDFSGYSDMAIGLGRMLGFRFPENFNYPYISASVTEFWRRWHISLGSWFREYVYFPLGGSRRGLPKQLLNILVVWMLTGIWHGAGWNFLLWGLWFAFALMLEKLFLGRLLAWLPKGIGILYTLLVALAGWVLFALETPAGIWSYVKAMTGTGVSLFDRQGIYLGRQYLILFLVALVASTPLTHKLTEYLRGSRMGFHIALYRFGEKFIPAGLLLLSIAGIVDASYNPFLYFRF